jgi:hypothetical protein
LFLPSASVSGAANKTKNASSIRGGSQSTAKGGEEVGQVEEEGGELPEGGLLNGLAFESVVSVWEICNDDSIFCVILNL